MRTAILIGAMLTLTVFYGCKSCCHNDGMMKEKPMGNNAIGAVDPNCGDNADCHVKRIRGQMEALIHHLRIDSEKVSDPQAKAMFETSAEVIEGLTKALHDYETGEEKVWKK